MCVAGDLETMRIIAYPLGDLNTASSRYRAYWPAEELGGKRFAVATTDNDWEQSTIVMFQRACTVAYQDIAKRAHNTRKFVVYDYTDFYWRTVGVDKPPDSGELKMVQYADLLTCCNQDDAWLLRRTFNKPVRILPNMQKLSLYVKQKVYEKTDCPVVLWVGYNHNIRALKSMWAGLQEVANKGIQFSVLIVNNDGVVPKLVLPRNIEAVPWSLKNLGDIMCRGDVAINPQIPCANGRYYKDNNKSVTAWAHGLACLSFDEVKNWARELEWPLIDRDNRAEEGEYNRLRARDYDVSVMAPKWWDILVEEYQWWKGPR